MRVSEKPMCEIDVLKTENKQIKTYLQYSTKHSWPSDYKKQKIWLYGSFLQHGKHNLDAFIRDALQFMFTTLNTTITKKVLDDMYTINDHFLLILNKRKATKYM